MNINLVKGYVLKSKYHDSYVLFCSLNIIKNEKFFNISLSWDSGNQIFMFHKYSIKTYISMRKRLKYQKIYKFFDYTSLLTYPIFEIRKCVKQFIEEGYSSFILDYIRNLENNANDNYFEL